MGDERKNEGGIQDGKSFNGGMRDKNQYFGGNGICSS